jgi:60 kDa SS-A/Ro ribonucleoprotein
MSIKSMARHISNKATPQTSPIPGRESEQVRNLAGGFTFPVDEWTRLDRFLILGTDGGAYYAGERELTADSASAVRACVASDGARTVNRIVEISKSGRAPKNDPALLALAIAAKEGDDETRRLALASLGDVARTATHLFAFAEAIEALGGWGRGTRTAVAKWYANRSVEQLGYQLVKYRQRNGWTHADMLRLAHAKPATSEYDALFRWAVKGDLPDRTDATAFVHAFAEVQKAESAKDVAKLVAEFKLPREAVPTQFLDSIEVWEALAADMPMTALVRNLATMSRIGLLTARAAAAALDLDHLTDCSPRARTLPHALLLSSPTAIAWRAHAFTR